MHTYEYETIAQEQHKTKVIAKLQGCKGGDEAEMPTVNYIRNYMQEDDDRMKQRLQRERDSTELHESLTIFSSQQDSNTTLLVSNKPLRHNAIKLKFICDNDLIAYSQSISNDALLYSYDQVYTGTNNLRMLYHKEIRDSVCGLVNNINSCIVSFGPAHSGKAFLLQEDDDSELGSLLNYSLFDLTDMMTQAHCAYSIKLSVTQVYMDLIHDLLSEEMKQIKADSIYRSNSPHSGIHSTKREIKTQLDFDCCIRNSIAHRKQLSQLLKVNELKEKSHLIVSLFLERGAQSMKGDATAQIDFVEFAGVNYGLTTQQAKSLEEDSLSKALSLDFDSLSDHIISSTRNTHSSMSSTLTFCLRTTLRPFSNITFINCLIPWEYPINQSLKSIRYSTWLREEIQKKASSSERNKANTLSYDSEYIAYPNKDNSPTVDLSKKAFKEDFKAQQHKFDNVHYSPILKETIDNNINFDSPSSNEEKENKIREKIKRKFNQQQDSLPFMEKNGDDKGMRGQMNQSYTNNPALNKKLPAPYEPNDKMINNTFSYDPLKSKDRQIEILNHSLMQLRHQNEEMNRRIDQIQSDKAMNNDDSQYLNNSNPQKALQSSSQYIESPYSPSEYEKVKQENTALKSDNIILREDISHLTNLTRHLEDELANQRRRNMDLAAENERILQEKIAMGVEMQKTNESIAKVKFQEHNLMESFNQRLLVENRMRDNENELMRLREDKQRFEIEYRVIKDRYEELMGKYDKVNSELMITKDKYESEIGKIEEKVDIMRREMDSVQRENITLRASDERQRTDFVTAEKQRDNYRDKYQEMKQTNVLLNTKIADIESDFKHLLIEKENEEAMKKEDESMRKYKIDSKQKIMRELQMKIANYRNERLKKASR